MENASLILAATLWRMFSYVFRALILGLSVIYADSAVHNACLLVSIVFFSMLLISTIRISELNAMGEHAHVNLLYLCTWLDRIVWLLAVLTLSSGLFNVTGF